MTGDQEKATIEKIDSFSFLIRPYYYKVENSLIIQLLLVIITLAAVISSGFGRTFVFGSMIFPATGSMKILIIILLNCSVLIIQVGLITVATRIFGESGDFNIAYFVLLGNLFSYIMVLILVPTILFAIPGISLPIPLYLWYFITIVGQVLFISIVSGALILNAAFKPAWALVLGLVDMYVAVLISLIFIG